MYWIRDWVYLVIAPFLTQLKNRLLNIKIASNAYGDILLTNSEGVVTKIEQARFVAGALGYVNINPQFGLKDFDYTGYVNGTTRKVVFNQADDLSSGSLYIKGSGATLLTDNMYPMAVDREYRATLSIKAYMNGGTSAGMTDRVKHYVGIICYDSDKRAIYPQHLINDAEGVLTVPVVAGDTTITMTASRDEWIADTAQGYKKSIKFHRHQTVDDTYRYIGINGRLYSDKGMSQWMMYANMWSTDDDIVDNGDGTITINLARAIDASMFLGSTNFEVGDIVMKTRGGGTYNYWISSFNSPADTQNFERYTSAWQSKDYDADPEQYGGVFRDGTAYIKMMVLPSYQATSEVECYYSKIGLEWRHKA